MTREQWGGPFIRSSNGKGVGRPIKPVRDQRTPLAMGVCVRSQERSHSSFHKWRTRVEILGRRCRPPYQCRLRKHISATGMPYRSVRAEAMHDVRLKKVTIRGYRSIENCTVDLGNINVLIGRG